MTSIMKIEDNRDAAKKDSDWSAAPKRIDNRDRQGNDIFGFSNCSDGGVAGKKKIENHQANQTNGNLTYWNK